MIKKLRFCNFEKKEGGRPIMCGVDYNAVTDIRGIMKTLSKSRNIIKTVLVKRYISKNIKKIISNLKMKKYIKPDDINEFVKFYICNRSLHPSDRISGSTSHIVIKDAFNNEGYEEYFSLRVQVKKPMDKDNIKKGFGKEIIIRYTPTVKPDIEISVRVYTQQYDQAKTVQRMFLDCTENIDYMMAWELMCDYIESFMLNQ